MNIKFFGLFIICGLLFFLEGCDPTMVPSKQTQGAGLGSVIGGIIGSGVGGGKGRTAAIVGGAFLGGLIGSSIGSYMDTVDKEKVISTIQSAPTGTTATWVNHGGYNSVTPTTNFVSTNDGRMCRKYQTKIIVEGNYQTGEGTACQRPDGYWDI